MKFEREVKVIPAYDKRDADPKKNYGIGAVRIAFYLKGPKGAIQFVIGTNWYLPSAREALLTGEGRAAEMIPMGIDVGYHSSIPMYEDQTVSFEDCDVLGGPCFYDGSTLWAEDWVPKFVEGGTDWLWPKMEEEYYARFEGDSE